MSPEVTQVNTCVSVCVGMEDISPGVVLPESADGGGRSVVGTSPAYSTHTDCLHFHVSVPVQHPTRVPLPGRGEQRGQRRYVCMSGHVKEHRCEQVVIQHPVCVSNAVISKTNCCDTV